MEDVDVRSLGDRTRLCRSFGLAGRGGRGSMPPSGSLLGGALYTDIFQVKRPVSDQAQKRSKAPLPLSEPRDTLVE